jgi:O-succinylbenzoic acid--CoA ligase
MTPYPHNAITINRRRVAVADIVAGVATAQDEFEANTFHFIQKWMSNAMLFELHTSGSTGIPKKVVFNRGQMEASARMTAEALSLQPGYTALICLDTRFVAGQMMLVRCLITGMAIVAMTPSANPLSGLNTRIDFAAMVPYQVFHILESTEVSYFNKIRTIIIGGAALDQQVKARLQKLDTRFYATYGMTETISHIALQKLNGSDRSDTFKSLPGISVNTDSRQCLTIKVPFLSEELVTNDLVELVSNHEFVWLGRWDNVLNSGGIKIIPEKVEEALRHVFENLGIQRKFFISSIPDVQFGDKIVLFVEGDEIMLQDQHRLGVEIPKVLSPYEIPKEVIILKSFEMTESGKLNRYRTRQNCDKSSQKFTLKK